MILLIFHRVILSVQTDIFYVILEVFMEDDVMCNAINKQLS